MQGIGQVGWTHFQTAQAAPPLAMPPSWAGLSTNSFGITAEDVADTALDFVPIAGGVKDIYKGFRDGEGWQVALGTGSIILDIFTLGGSSLAKGAILTGIKGGGRFLAKRATKTGGRVFWSGGDVAKNSAMSFAKANGLKTLEMTTGGRIMNTVGPYLPRSISTPIWDGLSRNFARGASGNIHVFQNAAGVSLRSTWKRIEYDILKNNNIIFHTVK